MVVTVIAVRMMQVTFHQIIHMVPVRHCFVSAIGAMHMPGLVTVTVMAGSTCIGIGFRHSDGMLVIMAFVRMVQMAVVQVVGVPIMLYGGVAASGAMLVVVVIVGMMMFGHILLSFFGARSRLALCQW